MRLEKLIQACRDAGVKMRLDTRDQLTKLARTEAHQGVVAIVKQNVALAKQIVKNAIERIPAERTCKCKDAAAHAIMTAPEAIPASARERLGIILDKYWSARS